MVTWFIEPIGLGAAERHVRRGAAKEPRQGVLYPKNGWFAVYGGKSEENG